MISVSFIDVSSVDVDGCLFNSDDVEVAVIA